MKQYKTINKITGKVWMIELAANGGMYVWPVGKEEQACHCEELPSWLMNVL